MRFAATIAASLLVLALAGCNSDDGPDPTPGPQPPGPPRDTTTAWYHLTGARPLGQLPTNQTLLPAKGGYSPIGGPTFEPSLGITSAGSIFMTSFRGLGGGTHVFRSQDAGLTFTDVGPFLVPQDSRSCPTATTPSSWWTPSRTVSSSWTCA